MTTERKTVKILLSDTHFGVRNNSVNWLNSQLRFFEKQLIPAIKQYKKEGKRVHLYHLGDMFDSRSSINPMILYKVNCLFNKIIAACDRVVIIGGNHDYYSPIESSFNVNSIDAMDLTGNVAILSNQSLAAEYEIFIPWFEFHNNETLQRTLSEHPECNIIYTHTDLMHLTADQQAILGDRTVVSGHIHTPCMLPKRLTLGSCFALTFADANQERGYYVFEDNDIEHIKFFANQHSIKFHRLHGEDAVNESTIEKIRKNDYVEVYISNVEFTKHEYTEAISKLNDSCTCNLIISNEDTKVLSDTYIRDFDIVDVCRQYIPEHLKEKFDKVVSIIKN